MTNKYSLVNWLPRILSICEVIGFSHQLEGFVLTRDTSMRLFKSPLYLDYQQDYAEHEIIML